MRRLLAGVAACLFSTLALAASGITDNGTDLDSIFAPYHAGWPQASATGITIAGTDLNSRYAPLSTGTTASAVPVTVAGTNLNLIFAGAGTTGVAISTQPSVVAGSAAAGNPSGTVTSNSTSCAAIHGNSSAYGYSWHIASGSASPTAASSNSSAVSGTVPAGTTISGTWYCTITDGVTSANTNTVSWSLQNTTPAFTGRTDTYATAGSFTDTVPAGATTMLVEVWGPSGAGGHGFGGGGPETFGGGGSSGGYSRSQYTVSLNAGQTVSITVSSPGSASTVASGSLAVTTMAGPSGQPGNDATNTITNGTGGIAGATGTGGNLTNSAGNAGGSPVGAAGVTGVNGTGNAGANGVIGSGPTPGAGSPGLVIIQFSP